RVIRVVDGTQRDALPERARAQLAFVGGRTIPRIETEELYLLDVQAVARLPDEPGADDPLYLYGMLRGPYPAALDAGVAALEGQLATTRGALLHGLALGTAAAFHAERGASGTRCVHAVLPGGRRYGATAPVVLAFPLVPMGEDATNELVAAQLFHDVIGALRTDLNDDLGRDPVPVPSRARYERELEAAGWTIEGAHAVRRAGGRIASLFTPATKQQLPREADVDGFAALAMTQVARLPGWPTAEVARLRTQLLLDRPFTPTRTPPPLPPSPRPTPSAPKKQRKADGWIKVQVDAHTAPDRPPPQVTVPGRVHDEEAVASWMYNLITGGGEPSEGEKK
ncbi:MAG: hypothetical protein NT062_18860, partial [Proteobacteria bacterium]|nr:hypothetical protein [Pseudomonadota bacterium]